MKNGIPQKSLQGPVQFAIFISDLKVVMECTLILSVGDTKLGSIHSRTAIQRNTDKVQGWTLRNLMKFNKDRWKAAPWETQVGY